LDTFRTRRYVPRIPAHQMVGKKTKRKVGDWKREKEEKQRRREGKRADEVEQDQDTTASFPLAPALMSREPTAGPHLRVSCAVEGRACKVGGWDGSYRVRTQLVSRSQAGSFEDSATSAPRIIRTHARHFAPEARRMVGVAQVRQLVPQHVVEDGRRMATEQRQRTGHKLADNLIPKLPDWRRTTGDRPRRVRRDTPLAFRRVRSSGEGAPECAGSVHGVRLAEREGAIRRRTDYVIACSSCATSPDAAPAASRVGREGVTKNASNRSGASGTYVRIGVTRPQAPRSDSRPWLRREGSAPAASYVITARPRDPSQHPQPGHAVAPVPCSARSDDDAGAGDGCRIASVSGRAISPGRNRAA